jgi:RNA polymerase sigma factor (sigma-70 family)
MMYENEAQSTNNNNNNLRGKRRRTVTVIAFFLRPSFLIVYLLLAMATTSAFTRYPTISTTTITATTTTTTTNNNNILRSSTSIPEISLEERIYHQRTNELRYIFPTSQDQRYKTKKTTTATQEEEVEKELFTEPTKKPILTSRRSTMPGFHHPQRRTRRRKTTQSAPHRTHTLYVQSPNVPDSMIQLTDTIHATTSRITHEKEVELGYKTQAAVRLQRQYDFLLQKLQREPTDEEWCAAAGKINMAAIRETLEEGKAAKEQLVTSNLRLVQSVVNTYLRNGISAQYNAGDLMQEGIVALIRAAEKFEPQRGWKFSTYAMYWVRSSVKHNQLQQADAIWVPQRIQEQYKKMKTKEQELTVQTGRIPTREELAEAMQCSVEQLEHCRGSVERKTVSLDAPLQNNKQPWKDGTAAALQDFVDIPDDWRGSLRQDLWDTLHRYLDPHQVELLLLRYCVTPTQSISEIARQVDMTPDKVRRTLHQSLKILRNVEEMKYFQQAFLHY